MKMPFETRLPDPRLSATILCYWRVTEMTPRRLYAATPKRHVEFVVNVGAPQLAGGAKEPGGTAFGLCWLTGMRESPIYIFPTGASVLYGVRFRDFAVPDWLTGEVRREHRWSTDLGCSSVTRGLVALIADCADLCAAAQVFNHFFLPHRALDPVVTRLTRAIRDCEQEDLLTPSGILRRFGGPSQHARGCVKKSGGVTLRRFARLARFDRALIGVDTERHLRIADIAQSVGYYDEAHMVHDFIAFCGVTPAAYRRARLAQECCQLPPHLFACD